MEPTKAVAKTPRPFPSPAEEDNPRPKPGGNLTRDNISEYAEQMLVLKAREVIPAMFDDVIHRLAIHDPKAFDQAAAIYGYIKAAPGVVINNLLQQNNYVGDESNGVYFEKIIKMMEQREMPKQPAHEPEIIDAEEVDEDEDD